MSDISAQRVDLGQYQKGPWSRQGSVLGELRFDRAAPQLSAYSRETAIAEKFQAMVKLGDLISRMKDFFDIMSLSKNYDFSGDSLAEPIKGTFAQRETDVTSTPVCFWSPLLTTERSKPDGQRSLSDRR
jgi:hypothetical protein